MLNSDSLSLRSRPMINGRTRYSETEIDIDEANDQAELLPKQTRASTSHVTQHSPTSIRPLWIRLRVFISTLPRIIFVLLAVTLLLLLDRLLRQPHGLIALRSLLGWSKYADASSPCGWDYEASWKIGIAVGTNPMTISPSHIDIGNPILTCRSLPSHIMNTSFVADPFLVLTPKRVSDETVHAIRPVHMPVSYDATPSSDIHLSNSTMYVFYEYKNLATGLGEIGVSSSVDAGHTFQFEGIALIEPGLHLSYPIIFYDAEQDVWFMLPETSMDHSIRIYSTLATAFPLGWTLHSIPLTGHRFVDTSPIFYQNQWIIFSTYDDSLHIYQSPSFTDASKPWIEHPLSPVVRNDRRYARSGGRPFLFDGKIHRIAQDDRAFYGARVYVIEVEVLSSTMYKEHVVRTIEPASVDNPASPWSSERLHQLDAHQIGANKWIALLDGDEKPDDYQFELREGWFRNIKLIALIVSTLITAVALLLVIRPSTACFNNIGRSLKQSFVGWHCLPHSFTRSYFRPAWMNYIISLFESLKLFLMSWRLMLLFIALFVVSFAFTALMLVPYYPIMPDGESGLAFRNPTIEHLDQLTQRTPAPLPPNVRARFVPDNASANTDINRYFSLPLVQPEDFKLLTFPQHSANFPLPPSLRSIGSSFVQQSATVNTLSYHPLHGLMLITAASSAYFDRLQNFVGSVHFWEPSQTLFIYDLGLTYEQAAEVRCWQRVTLLTFPFERYPAHVRNLYNYAWKTLMIDDAFHYHNASAVLVLDSGVELRRPFALSSIKSDLVERGYWLARQSNTVDAKTLPATLAKLSIDPAVVRGQTFCAGGLNGFTRSAAAYSDIVQPAIRCALDEWCISPVGSGRKTHNFDQSVISALVYASGRRCSPSRLYREWDLSLVTAEETNYNDIVFFLRRWHEPKPYIRHIKQLINNQCGYVPALKRAQRVWSKPVAESVKSLNLTDQLNVNRLESMLIQHRDGRHLESNSPLVKCLYQFNNSRVACVNAIDAYVSSIDQLGSSHSHSLKLSVDARGFSILHRIRSVNVWFVAFCITVAMCWLLMRFKRPPVSPTLSNRSVILLVLFVIVLTVGYPVYISSLNDHGTFFPLVALHLTKSYTMKSHVSSSRLSRPRVVFTMSTLPHQVEFINETLDSLAAQSIKPDTIYINLPNFNHRTNQSYEPPQMLLQGHWNGVPLVINRGEDIGPLTKLAPTLLVENEPDTVIISCDTDKRYPVELLATLLRFTEADPLAAWGVCGWGFLFRPAPVGVLPVYIPWALRGSQGRQVDVLQAVCGNAYRRTMFPLTNSSDMKEFMSPHSACFTTDDLWIAGWLATRSGPQPVPQVLIPGGLSMWSSSSPEPITASWKAAQGSVWDLSSINKAAGIDAACLRGVEQSLGPWRDRRENE